MPKPNPRKKKLDAICTKIATFIVQEMYVEENDLQTRLAGIITEIDAIAAQLVVNDQASTTGGTNG